MDECKHERQKELALESLDRRSVCMDCGMRFLHSMSGVTTEDPRGPLKGGFFTDIKFPIPADTPGYDRLRDFSKSDTLDRKWTKGPE